MSKEVIRPAEEVRSDFGQLHYLFKLQEYIVNEVLRFLSDADYERLSIGEVITRPILDIEIITILEGFEDTDEALTAVYMSLNRLGDGCRLYFDVDRNHKYDENDFTEKEAPYVLFIQIRKEGVTYAGDEEVIVKEIVVSNEQLELIDKTRHQQPNAHQN